MALGTIGSLVAALLSNANAGKDQERLQSMIKAFDKEVQAHNNVLSKKYFTTFAPYRERVSTFDSNITELVKEDIVVGEGKEITEDSTFWAYYIGWLDDGTVFDSSFDADKSNINGATELKGPFEVVQNGAIQGWLQGMIGAKIGGVRELTIPADLAYGDQASGDIPANSTLRFVIMTIDNPNQPQPSADLLKLSERTGGY